MPLPELATARLLIRPWEPEDLDVFHAIWSDPAVIWWGATADLSESRTELASLLARSDAAGAGLGWGALVADGVIVGNGMLGPAPGLSGDVEIGWHLARSAWGRGYATEAAARLLEHAFTTLKVDRVVAQIVPENHPSRAVATRLGMRINGHGERVGLLHDLWWVQRPTAGR